MNKYKAQSRASQNARRMDKMCLSKRGYETQEAATQKGQGNYHCPNCGKWHRTGQLSKLVAFLSKKKR